MILIADSGSTKTNWALLKSNKPVYYNSKGYNPYYINSDAIVKSVCESFKSVSDRDSIDKVYFYGAGCSADQKHIIINALEICFKNSEVSVESDLLGATRCLLGDKSGFAAILGTGTNSCFYNGKEIVSTIDSLGFLAGDEGSGSFIGKQLIKAYVRGYMPTSLSIFFKEVYGINSEELIAELYSSNSPNKFSAKFSLFAGQNHTHEFIKELVKYSFRNFFSEIMAHYPNYKGREISFVGSVAYEFQGLLKSVALEHNMVVVKVVKAPLESLIKYHTLPNRNIENEIDRY
jgi:glucosamine kinase